MSAGIYCVSQFELFPHLLNNFGIGVAWSHLNFKIYFSSLV